MPLSTAIESVQLATKSGPPSAFFCASYLSLKRLFLLLSADRPSEPRQGPREIASYFKSFVVLQIDHGLSAGKMDCARSSPRAASGEEPCTATARRADCTESSGGGERHRLARRCLCFQSTRRSPPRGAASHVPRRPRAMLPYSA